MSTGLEARGDDDVHVRVLQGYRLIRRGGGADGHDALQTTLVQDLSRRDSKNEAERRDFRVDEHAHLLLELHRCVRLVRRQSGAQGLNERREWREAAVERRL